MNYYIDTEFLEGTQKEKFPISLFRKETKPTIDLISIGIISEDNREYYAVSKDFNLDEAWNRFDIVDFKTPYLHKKEKGKIDLYKNYWIRENVLKPIWIDFFLWYESEFTMLKGKAYDDFKLQLESGEHDKLFTFKSFKALVNRYGKTNKQIAEEIKHFVYYKRNMHNKNEVFKDGVFVKDDIKFYAYYADYDWVAFCWLFVKMMDLPEVFPMYCRDLKQMLDEKIQYYYDFNGDGRIYYGETKNDFIYADKIKLHPDYPKQENEHNALDDARWNKKLHEFLNSI